jgi:hypothetical protein
MQKVKRLSGRVGTIDLATSQKLRTEPTNVANVWRASMPSQPWRFDGAEKERTSIVENLREAFVWQKLWLSDWASKERQGWFDTSSDESLSSVKDELSKGAWAWFFFDHNPGESFDSGFVPAEPADAISALRAVGNLGAAAAIWSWYDDNDWLVVLPSADGSGRPPKARCKTDA